MIRIATGNLLDANVDALVNTVNTHGVMGKGIALQFKQAYPSAFSDYLQACKNGDVVLGKMHVVDLGNFGGNPRWIINFPTKSHWKSKSRIEDIAKGLDDLVRVVSAQGIRSLAVPPLGCGNGGLEWSDVRPLIERKLLSIDGEVLLFPPHGAPDPALMPSATEQPQMTIGRASLIEMIRRYQDGLLDPIVSLLEVHKLMYFLQQAGVPLRLQFVAGLYGPYAENLRQVFIRLEGHWIRGYGDGSDKPDTPLELIGDASTIATKYLSDEPEVLRSLRRVAELIDGYEDAYGLELLSSVHWVMHNDQFALESPDSAIAAVHKWNARKRKLLRPEHLRKAWQRIHDTGWAS